LVFGLWPWLSLRRALKLEQTSKSKGQRPKTKTYFRAKLAAMDRRPILLFTLLLASTLSVSCAASLFKVKPVTELPALPPNSTNVSAGGIGIRVAPLLTDEEAQELFEANVPIGGVLAVRIEMNLEGGAPVELKKARFKVRDNQNREWKLLSTKQAVSRIMKANQVFAYNPYSKKQFEQDLHAYSFDTKTPLSSGHRSGFLFFQTPDKRPVDNTAKLTLVIERLPQPVNVALN